MSPVYEHFSETLSGLMTVRAFQDSVRFTSENERKLDFSQRADFSGKLFEFIELLEISRRMIHNIVGLGTFLGIAIGYS